MSQRENIWGFEQMVSARHEPVPAVAAVGTRLTMCYCFGAPGSPGTAPCDIPSHSNAVEKNTTFFLHCGPLEISFKSPFAGDPLKDCLATKPHVSNVLSTSILLGTTTLSQV